MLWPPIPYSYDTVAQGPRPPGAAAALAGASARHRRPGARRAGPADLRLPHLGAVRLRAHHPELGRSASPPAPCRAISAAWVDLSFQRFLEIWSSMPTLYLLIILASFIQPGFWVAARHHAAVQLDGAGRAGARRIPARAQFRLCARRPRARHAGRAHHVPAHPSQRHDREPHLPAVHPGRLGHDPDGARLPGLRPAAGLAVAGRAAAAGQEQPQRAVARLHRLRHRWRS